MILPCHDSVASPPVQSNCRRCAFPLSQARGVFHFDFLPVRSPGMFRCWLTFLRHSFLADAASCETISDTVKSFVCQRLKRLKGPS
jgi:hypothetical protein